MKIKIFLYFAIILLVLNTTYAKCGTSDNPCKDNWEEFDYGKGDISEIPADEVNIAKVMANKRGKELTKEQIKKNLDEIDNLNDVDLDYAKQVIREEHGVTVTNFGQGASLKQGTFKSIFGEQDQISINNEVYKNGFLEITGKGRIIFIPKNDGEIMHIEIPDTDSLTILTFPKYGDSGDSYYYEGYKINGRLSFENGEPYVKKRDNLIINGVKVDSILNDVKLCSIDCSGNYVLLDDGGLTAEGNGFILSFLDDSNYLDVDTGLEKDEKSIYLGDFDKKSGKVVIRAEEYLMTSIKTDGYVEMNNDGNNLVIDGDKVRKKVIKKIDSYYEYKNENPREQKGSVPAVVIADNDYEKVYSFDEDQTMRVESYKNYEQQNEKRLQMAKDYSIGFQGYFSNLELDIINEEAETISKKFDIDFNKLNKDGEPLKITEYDRRFVKPSTQASTFTAYPNRMTWTPSENLDNLKTERRLIFFKFIPQEEQKKFMYYKEVFGHELGHSIVGFSNPYDVEEMRSNPDFLLGGEVREKWRKKADEFGINVNPVVETDLFSGQSFIVDREILSYPEGLFPSDYSTESLAEHQAEIFRWMIHEPEWFTDPDVSEEIRKQRQEFRDIFLEELKKYKKS